MLCCFCWITGISLAKLLKDRRKDKGDHKKVHCCVSGGKTNWCDWPQRCKNGGDMYLFNIQVGGKLRTWNYTCSCLPPLLGPCSKIILLTFKTPGNLNVILYHLFSRTSSFPCWPTYSVWYRQTDNPLTLPRHILLFMAARAAAAEPWS